jgi:hypothetical protein
MVEGAPTCFGAGVTLRWWLDIEKMRALPTGVCIKLISVGFRSCRTSVYHFIQILPIDERTLMAIPARQSSPVCTATATPTSPLKSVATAYSALGV